MYKGKTIVRHRRITETIHSFREHCTPPGPLCPARPAGLRTSSAPLLPAPGEGWAQRCSIVYRNLKVEQPVEINHPQSRTDRQGVELKCRGWGPQNLFPFYEGFDVLNAAPVLGPPVFLLLVLFQREDLAFVCLRIIQDSGEKRLGLFLLFSYQPPQGLIFFTLLRERGVYPSLLLGKSG